MFRKTCMLCQRTLLKRWFGNRTVTSNCDVTNSPHQIQMTTLCHWMKPPPHENFLRTPLHKYVLTTNEVRAWLSKSYAISNATTCSRPRTKTAKQELYWFSVRACVRSVRIATCDFNAAIMFHNQLQERLEVSKTDLKYVLSIRTEDG